MVSAEQRSPFAPAPLQSLRHYYGLLRPCAPLRYSRPRGWSRLWLLPWHRSAGSHVPYECLVEVRAAYMPDAARAVSVSSPELIPEVGSTPGFDIAYPETRTPATDLSGSGETHIIAEVLYSLGESGSNTGLVAFDKKVSAEILVERAVLEYVVGGRQQ